MTFQKVPDVDETGQWLSIEAYAKKYGLTKRKVHSLKMHGSVKYKKGTDPLEAVYILDVPLDQQPVENKAKSPVQPYHGKARPRLTLDERRKADLKRVFMPRFLENAPPDKMTFSATEIMRMLGIGQTTLYRDWLRWGLTQRDVPQDFRDLNDERMNSEKFFYRRDIYRFLNGDFAPPEKGTTDDILIGAAEGKMALDGTYYKFDPYKVYPHNGEGVLAWIKDMEIVREDKRLNKWVRFNPWPIQEEFIGNSFSTKENGDYKYNLILFSAPRGEAKTYTISVLTLFRFFNHYGEVINLSGNSKDQVSFAHYELCKKIIQNTPKLKNTPGLVIKEKFIALMAGPKETVCQIKAIPTSTGLLPGTTCAVFTELHNLEDRKFFIDLWTSTRATPNAMVLVDTTVAESGHIVYELWESYQKGEDPLLYFFHYADKHYNPETTPEQLNSFKRHMLEPEYNRYFRNRWEDASGGLFSPDKVRGVSLYGVDGLVGQTVELHSAITQVIELEKRRNMFEKGKVDLAGVNREIAETERRFMLVDGLYKTPALTADLEALGKAFGCNFIIGVGLDRAQMIGVAPDRTVLTCVARGIVSAELSYYFILDMFLPPESSMALLTDKILEWTALYGWIDKIVIESYLGQDVYNWCIEHAYEAEIIYPSFKVQKPVFTALYQLVDQGHLKAPRIPYYTDEDGTLYRGYTNRDDILRDELKVFSYKADKWFGSPQKRDRGGVKDDTIYSLAWAVYATQGDVTPVGDRSGFQSIGGAVKNRDVIGDYK